MEQKTELEMERNLVIYNDLIVREYKELDENGLVDHIAVIKIKESSSIFTPNYFDSKKQGSTVNIWNWSFQEDIRLTNYFVITKIIEQRDEKTQYYRQIIFSVKDKLGDTMEFDAKLAPDALFTVKHIQKVIDEIQKYVGIQKSFEAIELTSKNQELVKKLDDKEELINLKVNEINDLYKKLEDLESKL